MNVTVPAIVAGTIAAAGGIAGGVLLERMSHDKLQSKQAGIDSQTNAANEWIMNANEHFDGEITADRLRNRDLSAQVEDYKIAHPAPSGTEFGRGETGWHNGVAQFEPASRDGFWFGTVGGIGAGIGGAVGGTMLGVALSGGGATTTGAKVAAVAGAALLTAGVGVALGAIGSKFTH